MLTHAVSYEVAKNRIKINGITYAETWTAEEPIGVFSFDKLIYKDIERDEFLAIKEPRKSKVWKPYSHRDGIVKLVYLKVINHGGIWIWFLTEDWSKSKAERINENEIKEVLERFRQRRKEYDREFFGGERVVSYIWQELLHFKVIERMNTPNALIVSTEPIARYFKPLPIIIDIG